MKGDPHPAREAIEPLAASLARHPDSPPGEHEIELSKAISLKRIADAMHNGGSPSGSVLWFLERIAEAMEKAQS